GKEHASMCVKSRVLWRVCVFSFLGQQLSRKALFDSAEQAELRGLPNKPWQPVTWKKAKVSRDDHLELATVKYSVPYTYVRRQVEAKITGEHLGVYCGGQVVAARRIGARKDVCVSSPGDRPTDH